MLEDLIPLSGICTLIRSVSPFPAQHVYQYGYFPDAWGQVLGNHPQEWYPAAQ